MKPGVGNGQFAYLEAMEALYASRPI